MIDLLSFHFVYLLITSRLHQIGCLFIGWNEGEYFLSHCLCSSSAKLIKNV